MQSAQGALFDPIDTSRKAARAATVNAAVRWREAGLTIESTNTLSVLKRLDRAA